MPLPSNSDIASLSLCVQEGGKEEEDFSKGVVFYLSPEERKVVGVLTWNLFGKMDVARKV